VNLGGLWTSRGEVPLTFPNWGRIHFLGLHQLRMNTTF
jgi:hypothetical protein